MPGMPDVRIPYQVAIQIHRYIDNDLQDFADVLRADGDTPSEDKTYQQISDLVQMFAQAIDKAYNSRPA